MRLLSQFLNAVALDQFLCIPVAHVEEDMSSTVRLKMNREEAAPNDEVFLWASALVAFALVLYFYFQLRPAFPRSISRMNLSCFR